MVSKDDVLGTLADTDRNCPLRVRELARRVGGNSGVVSVQLQRLSKEGLVAKKGEKGGWFITGQGKRRLKLLFDPAKQPRKLREKLFRLEYARELDARIENEEGTNYGKFLEIGKLLGVAPNRILLTAEYVWSGDYRDLGWIWRALGDMDIKENLRRVWFYSWAAFLKKSIPQELLEEIEGR